MFLEKFSKMTIKLYPQTNLALKFLRINHHSAQYTIMFSCDEPKASNLSISLNHNDIYNVPQLCFHP